MNEGLQLDSQAGVIPGRSPRCGSRNRRLLKRGGIALLMVALSAVVAIVATTGGEKNTFALPGPLADDLPMHAPEAPRLPYPQDSSPCGLHYAAVLDLAELARHYGKASGAYRHAFGSVANRLGACRTDARYAAAPSGPADLPRDGAEVSSYD